VPASAEDILHGKYDHRLIRTEGVIRSVQISEFNEHWTWLVLKCGQHNLYAATPTRSDTLTRFQNLLHAEIAIEGSVLPHDGSRRLRIGRIIHFTGPESVRLIREYPSGNSPLPALEEIDHLPPSEISGLLPHRIRGQILARWDANMALLVTDRKTRCRIAFAPGNMPNCHDWIEAIGFPECDLQCLNLSDARWHAVAAPSTNHTSCLIPIHLSRIDGDWPRLIENGSLIRLSGTVVALPTPGVNDQLLHISCNERLVTINAGHVPGAFSGLELGMSIEVTGVWINEVENYSSSHLFPRITGFFLVLRSPLDIRVVSRPSWLTPTRTLGAIGTLFAALIGIFAWNIALRKIATRKGRELFKEQIGRAQADLRTVERTRLAVELHDTLAQNLTGVSMEIEAAHDLRGNAPPAMLAHLGVAAKALKSCRDELRNCLWDLRSQALEETDMTKSIMRTLQPCINDSRLAVRFEIPRSRLSDNTAHTLLRVIRELVVNAIRHGAATSVKVAGTIDGDKLLCSVTDNGQGFDPDAVPGILQGHFGLQGIRERIDELGGEFTLVSTPGKGTKATIAVPIPREV